jgi:hypothetical protein
VAAAVAAGAGEAAAEDAAAEVGPELLFDVRRDGLVALLACGEPGLEVRGDDPVERRLVWPSGPVALGALGRQSGP